MMRDRRSTLLAAAGLTLLLAAACGPRPAAPGAHHPATIDEAKTLAAERGLPLLLDFSAPT